MGSKAVGWRAGKAGKSTLDGASEPRGAAYGKRNLAIPGRAGPREGRRARQSTGVKRGLRRAAVEEETGMGYQ
jgi:hypothetical protein